MPKEISVDLPAKTKAAPQQEKKRVPVKPTASIDEEDEQARVAAEKARLAAQKAMEAEMSAKSEQATKDAEAQAARMVGATEKATKEAKTRIATTATVAIKANAKLEQDQLAKEAAEADKEAADDEKEAKRMSDESKVLEKDARVKVADAKSVSAKEGEKKRKAGEDADRAGRTVEDAEALAKVKTEALTVHQKYAEGQREQAVKETEAASSQANDDAVQAKGAAAQHRVLHEYNKR